MSATTVMSIGRSGDCCVIRVAGRGTMRDSKSFRNMAAEVLDSPPSAIVVDLERCDYLDSTFLGCLLSLHKRYNTATERRFSLLAGPVAQQRLLRACHLDRVFSYCDSSPEIASSWLPVPTLQPEARELGLHVMECHDELSEIDCPSAAAFRRVAEQLASELGILRSSTT